jgi:hypothetical protein
VNTGLNDGRKENDRAEGGVGRAEGGEGGVGPT